MKKAPEPGTEENAVRRLILTALRAPESVLDLPARDLDLTLRAMRRARLLGRLAADLQELGRLDALPSVVADQLVSALTVAEARARVGRWELDRIAWALRELPEVPLVVLKGCAYLLAGTPNARGRSFADVDLLVPEADLSSVERVLRSKGWHPAELDPYDDRYYRVWAHELPPFRHVERDVEVDLHHSILMRTARLRPSSDLLFEAARAVPGTRVKVLAPTDMVLHAMVHLLWGGELDDAIRELVDISDLLTCFGERDPGFWEGFIDRAEALDLVQPAYLGLRLASRILATPVPTAVMLKAHATAPACLGRRAMDELVPRALFPGHPDRGGSLAEGMARGLLFARSHWLRMPPGTLLRHAWVKSGRRLGFRPSGFFTN